jgi:hypothetical protein
MTQTQTTSDAAAVDPVHAWDVHNERILGHLVSQDFESMDACRC